jgi:hypothetical protein
MATTGKFSVIRLEPHERGSVHIVAAAKRTVRVLVTEHALHRIRLWRLAVRFVLRTLLFPEEVLRGHRGRFIAQRRQRNHVARVVYEYEADLVVVVTVYNPLAKRYFSGGGRYEDQILA